jgi:hypothetical protein
VIGEAPYLFSVAALSVSLAGFAGLVAAFRRGGEFRPIDFYRLRQIAEFGFANALLSLLPIPLAAGLGDGPQAIRLAGALAFGYVVGYGILLVRQARGLGLLVVRDDPVLAVVTLNIAALAAALVAAATGGVAFFEWLLLLLLARPMLAFVLVLRTLHESR